jgi:hypothetical protein
LELDIEQVKFACELRGVSGSRSGSRSKLTLDLFKLIFPKLTNIDNRINEFFIQKIIYRNRKRFWYVKDIESIINDIRRQSNERRYKYKVNLKLVDAKDVVEP